MGLWDLLFGASEPVDATARAWLEQRFRFLQEQFGAKRVIESPIIEPTAEFFPDTYTADETSIQALFRRVCRYMDVAPELVDLRVNEDRSDLQIVNDAGHDLPSAAGTYEEGGEGFIINVGSREAHEPMHLVGTLAHELSHLRLLGENRIDPDVFDNELLTDLTATYFGFGIFLANSPRHWHSHLTYWPDTKIRRPEYMTLPMYGYALALIAQLRFEENPKWAKHLRRDSRSEFRAAMRFMNR